VTFRYLIVLQMNTMCQLLQIAVEMVRPFLYASVSVKINGLQLDLV
jgi:hypothetical protein